MTASDYIHQADHARREHELILRNERHRVALERQGVRPGRTDRRRLSRLLRHRLTTWATHSPAPGA